MFDNIGTLMLARTFYSGCFVDLRYNMQPHGANAVDDTSWSTEHRAWYFALGKMETGQISPAFKSASLQDRFTATQRSNLDSRMVFANDHEDGS